MADEHIKLKIPLRPILAVALAGGVSLFGPAVLTRGPVTMILLAVPCVVLQVPANLFLFLRLRSWSLGKATALAALADILLLLGVYALLFTNW